MKRIFILPVMALFWCQPYSQSGSPLDYEGLMNSHRGIFEDFIQAREGLETAGGKYVATIEKIFGAQPAARRGPSGNTSRSQQRQLERMIHVAPVFVGVAESKEELNQRLDTWVSGFSREFGLADEQEKAIRRSLSDYARAYGKYLLAYNKLQEVVNYGRPLPPAVPPPPPPPQQHHGG